MLKRIANIVTSAAAHGAGAIVGVRGGNDAYDWVKSGDAKRAVKRLAGDAEAKVKALTSSSPDDEAARRLRESQGSALPRAGRAQVACEKCGEPAYVDFGQGEVVVKCKLCAARFWVDTDELAKAAPPR